MSVDLRENFLSSVTTSILSLGVNPATTKKIENILLSHMDNLEFSPRCTDLIVVDNELESIFKMYFGSLLMEGKSRNTVNRYCYILKRFATEVNKPVLEVTSVDIKIWLAKVSQTVEDSTVSNYRNYISAFYKWLHEEEYISNNPMKKVKTIKVQDKVRLAFSTTDIDAMRFSCDSLRERAEFEFLLSTGVRVDEMCNIKISDVDFVKREIIVQKAKGNKQRVVYTNDICLSHLVKYINSREDTCPYLFVSRLNGQLTAKSIQNDVKRIGNKAGVDDVHPHRFRRTFATSCYERGMDIRTIQLILGHTNLNTTMRYLAESKVKVKHRYEMYAAS